VLKDWNPVLFKIRITGSVTLIGINKFKMNGFNLFEKRESKDRTFSFEPIKTDLTLLSPKSTADSDPVFNNNEINKCSSLYKICWKNKN
jgi:hypothetical protein